MTDNSWINDFMDAVVQAEQTEHEVTELSESAARGLLAWCLQPLDGGVAGADGTAGGGAGFTVSCVRCGTKYQHQPPSWDSAGSYLDYLFACGPCKRALSGIFGTPASPGRPAEPAHDTRVKRLRGLSHRLSAIRQGVQPDAPVMPRPSAGRPSASRPAMPRPGP